MKKIIVYNFLIAAEAIAANKLRAMLTSLGIICGVASVIAMMSIGKGAQNEILEKMKLLGTNNVIIRKLDTKELEDKKKEEEDQNDKKLKLNNSKKFSPGLSISDAESIKEVVPGIANISPEVIEQKMAFQGTFRFNVNLVGITSAYFKANNFDLDEGELFSSYQLNNALPVCIIGNKVKLTLFPTEDPIGKSLKCGGVWLKVIGCLDSRKLSESNMQSLNIRNYNEDIYTPINTMLLRFTNRSLITTADLQRRNDNDENQADQNYNQIDRIVVNFKDDVDIKLSAEIMKRLLLRRHNAVDDFEVIVPELLLAQEQSTKRIFNIVLGVIASISLIVGGIGIMNIMLASVLERMKEIGIRKALGATKNDILLQFLIEAVSISLAGGIIGIFAGIASSYLIRYLTDIQTILDPFAMVLSFFVSISVGLIFGITPARRASLQDPITLLHYE